MIHRVKGYILITCNNLKVAEDCQRTRKYVEADNFTGEITGKKFFDLGVFTVV